MTALIIIGIGFALLSLAGVIGIIKCNSILNEEMRNERTTKSLSTSIGTEILGKN